MGFYNPESKNDYPILQVRRLSLRERTVQVPNSDSRHRGFPGLQCGASHTFSVGNSLGCLLDDRFCFVGLGGTDEGPAFLTSSQGWWVLLVLGPHLCGKALTQPPTSWGHWPHCGKGSPEDTWVWGVQVETSLMERFCFQNNISHLPIP